MIVITYDVYSKVSYEIRSSGIVRKNNIEDALEKLCEIKQEAYYDQKFVANVRITEHEGQYEEQLESKI